ncbi:MAG: FAD binding domain-containing protein [Gaiellaceae bacterium]
MISRRFDYHAPHNLDQAVALLDQANGDATIVGGGTWVVPEMTHGQRTPAHVIDLRNAGIAGVEADVGGIKIGATTTYSSLRSDPLVRERAELLSTMAVGVTGGAQVRNQATIGGSACYATPSSDAPGALVALDARMRLVSTDGVREIDAEEFFVGAFDADLKSGEILSEIIIPEPPANARWGYYKLKLVESSWPIATAGCVVGLDDAGAVASARVAVGGVNTRPYVVDTSELIGRPIDAAAGAAVTEAARALATDPYSDVLASGEYRQQVSGVVAKRALLAAAA